MSFRAGFVTIIGKPNSGKSTLLNALLGEKISIVTSKIQTTRHRIKGILSAKDYQIVFSDTPGIIAPKYELHKSMMKNISESLEDADVVITLIDPMADKTEISGLGELVREIKTPVIVAINKSDAVNLQKLSEIGKYCREVFSDSACVSISALKKINLENLVKEIVELLPEQPAFYDSEEITDKSERFIVSEIIREKIFEQFQKEVPYSSEVLIQDWKDSKELLRIRAEIIVERESQKAIILGKGGSAIKKLGIAARKEIEEFLRRGIFLGLTVKVNPNWRNNPSQLKYFGY